METYTQYSREELDQLYSPSRYSKKLPADVVVAKHVQAVEQCEMATITHTMGMHDVTWRQLAQHIPCDTECSQLISNHSDS